MRVHYSDDQVVLLHGDVLETLASFPDGAVDCIVTSPPYFGLRDYGIEGQYGLESSPTEYVANLCKVFHELRRVLADDGTCWLNIGDSYYSGRGNPGPNSADLKQPARRGWVRPVDRPGQSWARQKDLLGIPWRTAFAFQDDGWILRNAIVWYKRNAMPQSVTDRVSGKYEHIFLFAKSKKYWFDLDAIREPAVQADRVRADRMGGNKGAVVAHSPGAIFKGSKTRNPGDVWLIDADIWDMTTQPFPEAHFAVYPPELPRRCIKAGCRPEGTVLDPFHGSGTTGMVAAELGRNYIGIDLNPEYLELSLRSPKRLNRHPEQAP